MSSAVFNLYRYQIIPVTNQYSLLYSLDERITQKNEFFWQALIDVCHDSTNDGRIKNKIKSIILDSDNALLVSSKEKNIKIYNEDSVQEHVQSYPPAYIFIDNRRDYQIAAVQDRPEYSSTKSILSSLVDRIRRRLALGGLYVEFSPIYKERSFWGFINEYKDNIKEISFRIITPNMPSISSSLSDDLKNMAKMTNASKTDYKITAAPGTHLDVSQENHGLVGLADYTSRGGGNAQIKIHNTKIMYKSDDYQAKIELNDLELTGNPDTILSILFERIAREVSRGSGR